MFLSGRNKRYSQRSLKKTQMAGLFKKFHFTVIARRLARWRLLIITIQEHSIHKSYLNSTFRIWQISIAPCKKALSVNICYFFFSFLLHCNVVNSNFNPVLERNRNSKTFPGYDLKCYLAYNIVPLRMM